MKTISTHFDGNVKIVFDRDGKFYIKFRTFHFFRLIKIWWYVLSPTYYGLTHRPFYDYNDATRFIGNNFQEYYAGFLKNF